MQTSCFLKNLAGDKMKKKRFYLILLIVAVIYFFPASRSVINKFVIDRTAPIQFWLSKFSQRVRKDLGGIFRISSLMNQNEELSEKLAGAKVDQSRIEELQFENGLLKKELGFFEASRGKSLVPVKIIDRDPISYLDYVIVDKGKDFDVAPGMAVTASGTLVGQVREVFDHTAKIVLITSKDSIVQAMLQESRAKGILKGGIAGLFLDNITTDTTYKEGENVITSGLGGNIEEGILIGGAGKIESSSSGIFKTISVEPICDFSKLEIVFIQK